MTVKDFLRRPDIPDSIQQFFPVHSASIPLKPLIIQGKALDDVLVEALSRPLAEAGTNDGMDAVAYGNDDVEVVIICRFCRKIGNPDFSYRIALIQFSVEFPLQSDPLRPLSK